MSVVVVVEDDDDDDDMEATVDGDETHKVLLKVVEGERRNDDDDDDDNDNNVPVDGFDNVGIFFDDNNSRWNPTRRQREDEYDVEIESHELDFEYFGTVEAIEKLVASKLEEKG